MDQATFDAYVVANPPGAATNGLFGNPAIGRNATRSPFSTGSRDIYGQQQSQVDAAAAGAKHWENFFNNGPASVTPTAFDASNADQARGWQQQLMQDLQRQAAGDPNSRAQQSLTQGYGAARAGQSALGSGLHGTGGGAGLRAGVLGAGNVQRNYAGDQQILMTQEQQAAQALLAQQLAAQRGQDAQQAQGVATNTLGNQALTNAMNQFYSTQGLQSGLNREQTSFDRIRTNLGLDLENANFANRVSGMGVQALGTAGATAASFAGGKKKTSQQAADDAFDGNP
jgi:hypothetical protein